MRRDMKGFHYNFVKMFLLLLFAQVSMAQTDFLLTVSPSGNPITLPAGGGQSVLTYSVSNDINGVDEGDQTTVTFLYDSQLEPVSVTAFDENWSCSQLTGQSDCNYNGIYPAGYSSDLMMFITTPVNPINISAAVNKIDGETVGDRRQGSHGTRQHHHTPVSTGT